MKKTRDPIESFFARLAEEDKQVAAIERKMKPSDPKYYSPPKKYYIRRKKKTR